MKRATVALIACLLAPSLFAATRFATVRGPVVDEHGGPLPGFIVSLRQGRAARYGVSDETGIYSFERMRSGTYVLTVEMPGFLSPSRDVVIDGDVTLPAVEIAIDPAATAITLTTDLPCWDRAPANVARDYVLCSDYKINDDLIRLAAAGHREAIERLRERLKATAGQGERRRIATAIGDAGFMVRGTVMIETTALPDCVVTLAGKEFLQEVVTYIDGSFAFIAVPAGRYELRITAAGLNPAVLPLVVTHDVTVPAQTLTPSVEDPD